MENWQDEKEGEKVAKKYFWLKLKEDFFSQPRIKKLRRIAGGDTYTIIYLKMQLLSLKNDGVLIFEGIEDDFVDELALTIDEDTDNVRFTVMFLISQGMMEEVVKDEYALVEAMQNMGSETAAASRVRKHRENKKALQSNTDVTNCNTEIEKEIDIDIELEKDKKKKPIRHKYGEYNNVLLSDEDMEKLKNEFPTDWEKRIERLSEYIASTGKSYKSHLATIRSWARKEVSQPSGKQHAGYDNGANGSVSKQGTAEERARKAIENGWSL